MPKVAIVMGSDSDLKVMSKAASMLEKLGIDYEMTIISAHREPDIFFEYAKTAEERGKIAETKLSVPLALLLLALIGVTAAPAMMQM